MRVHLMKIENAFRPGFTVITWISTNLNEYFEEIDNTLAEIEQFLKLAEDLKSSRIEENMKALEETELIFLPEEPIKAESLLEKNIHYRLSIEDSLQDRSLTIEKACVELINLFIDKVDVSDVDEDGQRVYQLPQDQIDSDNIRVEELMPIDKYDWICFENIYKAVSYPNDELFANLCKLNHNASVYPKN